MSIVKFMKLVFWKDLKKLQNDHFIRKVFLTGSSLSIHNVEGTLSTFPPTNLKLDKRLFFNSKVLQTSSV
jgi:hypothetical protein